MKTLVILLDGMYDERIPSLGYKTPLDIATMPGLKQFEKNAKYFTVKTSYEGLPVGSIIANMGLLGYDPRVHHSAGRAIYEVLAKKNISDIRDEDLIMRLNYVSLDTQLNLIDFTGGQIKEDIAIELSKYLNEIYCEFGYEIVHGKSYRNTFIIRDSKLRYDDFISFEPHMNRHRNIRELLLRPTKKLSVAQLKELNDLNMVILNSNSIIAKFMKDNFPTARANSIALWGQSYKKELPKISELDSGIKRGVIITGSDFLMGIAKLSGIEGYTQNSFTGEIDSDISGKFMKVKEYLSKNNDLIYLHINAPDEAAHILDPILKTKLLEKIDKNVLFPLYQLVEEDKDINVVILGDHYTSSLNGKHLNYDVPALVYNARFENNKYKLNEQIIAETIQSYDLLKRIRGI